MRHPVKVGRPKGSRDKKPRARKQSRSSQIQETQLTYIPDEGSSLVTCGPSCWKPLIATRCSFPEASANLSSGYLQGIGQTAIQNGLRPASGTDAPPEIGLFFCYTARPDPPPASRLALAVCAAPPYTRCLIARFRRFGHFPPTLAGNSTAPVPGPALPTTR